MLLRKFGGLVSLVVSVLVVTGACVAPAAPAAPAVSTERAAVESSSAANPVTIQIFYPVAVDAPIAQILNGYIADFEKANPDVKVEPVFSGGYTDVKTAIQTTIGGGGEPPALAVMLATDIYDLINADSIVPLDDYIAAMPDGKAYLDDFIPAFLENSRFDGKLWSIPFQRSAVVLYYNADLFAEKNIKPPDSWESWATAAQTLTERSGDKVTRWGIEFPSDFPYWVFQPLAIGAGQNIVGEADNKVFFDNPAVIEAVQFYIDLSKVYNAMPEGVQANWGQAPTDLASGQTAMIVHSSGSLTGILKQAKFKLGVMPIPGKKAGTYASVPGGGNLYIFKGAPKEKQDAAWRFVEFLTQPQYAADYSINTGYIASRQSAYDTDAMKEYLAKVPQAQQTREALKYAGAEMSVQNLGKVRDLFHEYLQKAFNREMSAADAMAAAQKAADEALADFK